jgi:hypothetical protein
MPGPGRGKSKAKSKAKAVPAEREGTSAAGGSYVDDIDNARGWDVVVDILCRFFELPGSQPFTIGI